MTAPEAGGERFIAATRFLWMAEIGEVLRERLGETASKVPTRTVPNLLVRGMALFDPGIRSVVGAARQAHRALVREGEERRSAGRLARSRTRSPRRARA